MILLLKKPMVVVLLVFLYQILQRLPGYLCHSHVSAVIHYAKFINLLFDLCSFVKLIQLFCIHLIENSDDLHADRT